MKKYLEDYGYRPKAQIKYAGKTWRLVKSKSLSPREANAKLRAVEKSGLKRGTIFMPPMPFFLFSRIQRKEYVYARAKKK